MADEVLKSKLMYDMNSKNVDKILIPPKGREEILNELRQVL